MKKIKLKKNEDKRLRNGHLWVFSNEVMKTEGDPINGDLVEVYDSKDQFVGCGFFNKNSLIALRLISKSKVDDLKDLFNKRIANAYELRKSFYPNRESFRMVFSESDYLPGLIIDKYNNSFVLQINSCGIENNILLILEILKNKFNAKNIFSKNDFYLRRMEGLAEEDTAYYGAAGIEVIDDGYIKYKIDFNESQKTGFYFDQSDNRFFVEKIVEGKNVADVFSNCGGFGMHALKAGAKSVDFIDSSSREIDKVKENLSLNKLDDNSICYVKDAFDFLEENKVTCKKYDIVMLDPPAFAKNKKSLPSAEKGYEKLNRLALQIVNDGGYLVTSSCSYHMKKDNFLSCIDKAALKTSNTLQIIKLSGASLDHPQLLGMEETSYLKFVVFRVFKE